MSQLAELGISDVGIYYPIDPAQLRSFEEIAISVIPALRLTYQSI